MKTDRPAISSLENPLYYLENFRTVIDWVASHHGDLLSLDELASLEQFATLSTAAQGLLTRLVMRRGSQFRLSKLSYPELGTSEEQAARELCEKGWLGGEPVIDPDTLFRLFTRPELLEMLAELRARLDLPKSVSKQLFLEALGSLELEALPLLQWSPECSDRVVELMTGDLFERIRLMFFGNLRQDWSEFVLTELGHQQYEMVPFSPESRAFQERKEVDRYLHLAACRDAIDSGIDLLEIYALIPLEKWSNPWLQERRDRLLYTLGHQAERDGELELALQVYAQSNYSEALIRRLRVMERQGDYGTAHPLLEQGLSKPVNSAQKVLLQRIQKRLYKKLGLPAPKKSRCYDIPLLEITVPATPGLSVEEAAARRLSEPDRPVYYVENWLFNGLFALLCWPALYAPLRGAFFHPFHAGPADLYREGFTARREQLFENCFSKLDSGEYVEVMRKTWHEKWGISCYFMHWELLHEEVLELALECIPRDHLRIIFMRMLDDLRGQRSGLPDLVQFHPRERRYALIEVKGPGDRLQDNQRRWFDFFLAQGIPAILCKLSWEEGA